MQTLKAENFTHFSVCEFLCMFVCVCVCKIKNRKNYQRDSSFIYKLEATPLQASRGILGGGK